MFVSVLNIIIMYDHTISQVKGIKQGLGLFDPFVVSYTSYAK